MVILQASHLRWCWRRFFGRWNQDRQLEVPGLGLLDGEHIAGRDAGKYDSALLVRDSGFHVWGIPRYRVFVNPKELAMWLLRPGLVPCEDAGHSGCHA